MMSPVEAPRRLPITPLQQSMLLESLRAPAAGCYVEQIVCRTGAPLDAAALGHAWEKVIQRHAGLRTQFVKIRDRKPLQRLLAQFEMPRQVLDWRKETPETAEALLEQFLSNDRAAGFDFNAGPPHRLTIVQWPGGQGVMVWTLHHALCDGRGMAAVLKEVFALLDGAELVPLGTDAPATFHHALSEADVKETAAFWRRTLDGFSEPALLPLAAPASPVEGVGAVHRALEPETMQAVAAAAARAGVRVTSVLQAALGLLLARYQRRDDTGFYFTKSLRHLDRSLHDQAGLFINTLFLRLTLDHSATVTELLCSVDAAYAPLRAGELAPVSRLAGWSDVAPGQPLGEVYFMYDRGDFEDLVTSLPGDWNRRSFTLLERPPSPLSITVFNGARPQLLLEYNQMRFEPEAIRRFQDHYLTLLGGILRQPEAPLRALEVLPDAERRLVLETWQPHTLAGVEETLTRLIERQAAASPDAPALEAGGQRLSYRELLEQAGALAAHVASEHPGGGPVAVMAPRSAEMILAVLAVLRTGAAYLPIDTTLPEDRVRFMLEDAGAHTVLTTSALQAHPALEGRRILLVDAPSPPAAQVPTLAEASPEDTAYIIYTSGSTGKPKGVLISHRAACTFVRSGIEVYGIRPEDRLLQFASLSFDASVEEIFCTLACGATLVLRDDAMIASIPVFLEECARRRVSYLDLPTAYWHLLADAVAETPLPECIRAVLVGGEEMRPDKVQSWRRHVPDKVLLINGYGPTETTVVTVYCHVGDRQGTQRIIGKPFPRVEAYVLDPHLNPLPIGVPGELCLGGPQLADGYLNRPELNATSFPPHPFREGEHIYRTGDRVSWDAAGVLHYWGRIDRQVKVRGFRIELGEIEAALDAHPAVAEAAVMTLPDALGNQQLHAYLVWRNPADGDVLPAIKARLAEQLPAYMQPATYTVLEELPKTNSGKIDRRALPSPAHDAADADTEEALQGQELEMARLWAEVLGVRQVRRQDNFFELGGHSLLAFVLLSRIEKQFGKRLPPIRIYQAPTLADFTRQLGAEHPSIEAGILHRIQPGKRARIPLHFVGSTDLLPAALPALGKDLPVYSLNIFGLLPEEGELPDVSVPHVAEEFIQAMRTVQRHGPYCLGGYCRDALVALEMARQLREAGEEVLTVLMVDVFWGAPHHYSWARRHLRNLRQFGGAYVADKLRRRLRWLKERAEHIRSNRAARKSANKGRLAQQHRNALFVNRFYEACLQYVPAEYDGEVTVILASEWGVDRLPDLEHLCREVHIREVRAHHQNLWTAPQALELGRVLRACLDAAMDNGRSQPPRTPSGNVPSRQEQ